MPEKEFLIRLLERVRNRCRSNDALRDAAGVLAVCFSIPVAFKMIDLVRPFRGLTVTLFFLFWAAATASLIAWRARRKPSLTAAAAALDRTAKLNDEIKTALWFIQHPQNSGWVDAQIARAASTARALNPAVLFPRVLPEKSYAAGALALLLAVLNFLPLPLNHNWLILEAAPAFDMPAAAKALVDEVKKLLAEVARPGEENRAIKVDDILKNLKAGRISLDEALRDLESLMQELRAAGVNANDLSKQLSEIAEKMGNAKLSESVESALAEKELPRAIGELREADDSLLAAKSLEEAIKKLDDLERERLAGKRSPEALKERLDNIARDLDNSRLPPAAANALASRDIPRATDAMKQTATSLSQGFANLSTQDLMQIAEQLVQMAQSLENQQNAVAAGQALQSLANALAQSQGQQPGQQGQQGQRGQPGQPGQPGQQGQGSPDGPPSPNPNSQGGLKGNFQGRGGPVPPGASTSLEVQLQKEAMVAEHAETEISDLRSASQKERSKLGYRDVQSALTSAQKDVLDNQRIPWESKEHIKNYFDAIHEPGAAKR